MVCEKKPFKALWIMARACRVLAYVMPLIIFIIGISYVIRTGSFRFFLWILFSLFLYYVVFILVSDGLLLLLSIEKNIRKLAQKE